MDFACIIYTKKHMKKLTLNVHQVRIRVKYWLTRPPQLYTVLVQRVPAALQDEARLQRYFERLFGTNSVHKVTPVVNVAKVLSHILL